MQRSSLLFLFVVLLAISTLSVESKKPHHKDLKKQPKKASANPTHTFCKNFIKQCYHEGLDGKQGKVNIEFACKRQGPKQSTHFSFGCKADGVDLTKNVLDVIGSGYNVTSGSTFVVTNTVTDVATSVATVVQEIGSTIVNNVTAIESATLVSVGTVINTQSVTQTTLIPITATSTSISTVTTTTPVVATSTSQVTSYILGNEPIPVVRVSLPQPKRRKRMAQLDSSQFCSAYTSACQAQCTKVKSKPKHVICQSTSSPSDYQLTCYCKNKKVKTQHALAAAMGQQNIASVSTVGTSTSYATVTSTTVVPTTVLSTAFATITSTIPVTNTYTSFSTATQTTVLTSLTGSPTIVATTVPVSVTMATATTYTTTTVSSTTQVVIAPTGRVLAIKQSDGTSQGYITAAANSGAYLQTSASQARIFAAVMDPASGYYQLQATDGTGMVLAGQEGNPGTTSEFFSFNLVAPVWCGTAGSTAGPSQSSPSSNFPPCQTVFIHPVADSETPLDHTTNLLVDLYGLGNTTATQYTWMSNPPPASFYAVANPTNFQTNQLSSSLPLTFRFPV